MYPYCSHVVRSKSFIYVPDPKPMLITKILSAI